MPISEAKKKANAKFNATAYDRLELKIPKGKKDEIKSHAEKYQNEVGDIGTVGYSPKGSMTGFISRAINETMERDKSNTPNEQAPQLPVEAVAPATQPTPAPTPEQAATEQLQQPQEQPTQQQPTQQQPTQQRQSFEEFLSSLPDSVKQTRSKEDLFMQYRESMSLA